MAAAARDEVADVVRAASGGMLFGVPLLYTMEVWWTGIRASPVQGLVVLALAFVAVLALNHTAGFRRQRDVRLGDAALDALEAVAVSVVLAAFVLFLLAEITSSTPLGVALGKITFEALPITIGVGVAAQFLADRGDPNAGGVDRGGGDDDEDEGRLNATLADVGATAIGAVFIALNIAPTDEIPMLDSAMGPPRVLALVGASLALSYVIVFVAGFSGQPGRRAQQGLFQHPLTETIVCYLVSLAAALAMLWTFNRTEGPWSVTLTHTIVLGLPAAVGGAAGRIAI